VTYHHLAVMRERLINAFAADFTVWLIVMDQGVNTKKQLGNPAVAITSALLA
jgi:hypothetical protein